jgi:hypothetical protein
MAVAGVSYAALTAGIGLTPGGALFIIGGTILACAVGPERLRNWDFIAGGALDLIRQS